MKKALVTGANGQDATYLIDLLLFKDYEVHGTIRRHSVSSSQTSRLETAFPNRKGFGSQSDKIKLFYAELTDPISLNNIFEENQYDEIYNLAAMSHVRVSFDQPSYTLQTNTIGVLNLLEVVRRRNPEAKIYQASSSEMFGNNIDSDGFQRETTPMMPVSPYGVSKLAAHSLCHNYRKSYGMKVSCGILFNHESIPKNSPVVLLKNNEIDVLPIEDLFNKSEKHRYEGLQKKYEGSEIWDGTNWTKIIAGTCYQKTSKPLTLIQTREACCETTSDHHIFLENNSHKSNQDISMGEKLFKVSYPSNTLSLSSCLKTARLLGFIVGDGHISTTGKIRLTGTDKSLLEYYFSLLSNQYGWTSRISSCISPFGSVVFTLDIDNDCHYGQWLHKNIYTRNSKEKRVPKFILNSSIEVQREFFMGYYDADGRKKGNEKYEWKGWTTSSATLNLGLCILIRNLGIQVPKTKCEYRNGSRYYYTQLTCPYPTCKGKHRIKSKNEVIRLIETQSTDGWFFDLQTESKAFSTGANLCKIHNSPLRGENFVTAKIVRGALDILKGKKDRLLLGNLKATRDWGHAFDYTYAMYDILQLDRPDDYVCATGISHRVEDVVDYVFGKLGLDKEKHLGFDERFLRPEELNDLKGDATKLRNSTGWKPTYTFETMLDEMIEHWRDK